MDQPKLDIPALAELLITAIDPEQVIPDKLRAIILDNMELAIEECPPSQRPGAFIDKTIKTAKKTNTSPTIPEPVKSLLDEDIKTMQKIANDHDWDNRFTASLNPLEWVLTYYKPWIPGLLTGHIKQANPKLYPDYMRYVSQHGLPDGIDIPTNAENEMRKQTKDANRLAYDTKTGRYVLKSLLPRNDGDSPNMPGVK